MRRGVICSAMAGLLLLGLGAGEALAETTVKERSCQHTFGSNVMTYDCAFQVKGYELGEPVTFDVAYACTGQCGPVLSFGISATGFSGNGVTGRLVGGARTDHGLQVSFVFDSLQRSGPGNKTGHDGSGPGRHLGHDGVAWAHFTMNVGMDDGAGNSKIVPCSVDVHLTR